MLGRHLDGRVLKTLLCVFCFQALFNLGFMVEEGVDIPSTVLDAVQVPVKHRHSNITLLEYLYTRFVEYD